MVFHGETLFGASHGTNLQKLFGHMYEQLSSIFLTAQIREEPNRVPFGFGQKFSCEFHSIHSNFLLT